MANNSKIAFYVLETEKTIFQKCRIGLLVEKVDEVKYEEYALIQIARVPEAFYNYYSL